MVNSFEDAFERARKKLLAESGAKVDEAPAVSVRSTQTKATSLPEAESFASLLTPRQKQELREEARKRVKVTYGSTRPPGSRLAGKSEQDATIAANVRPVSAGTAHLPQKSKAQLPAAPIKPPDVTVSISNRAACNLGARQRTATSLLSKLETVGHATQIQVGKPDDEREVVLGLDFGTSCVKVVIGDSALGKAFAVPFRAGGGISSFLLTSRLYQTDGLFSLEAGVHIYRDLKLSLLANPEDLILQQRVVAFLALIIRRARGWLLTEHGATYKRTAIVWKLAVGLPAAQFHQSPLSKLFERLSKAAWEVAGAPADVNVAAIQRILESDLTLDATANSVEVSVVPEIAAQIYGFVASNSFDKQAPNIYLMADVGSGTVDSSLFHVKLGKGGRWDFEFYTSVVEPNGVSNLHRHRVKWWTDVLTRNGASRHLIDDLDTTKLITDQQFPTPESYADYFSGIEVKFRPSVKSPDDEFFNLRVLAQVQGKTLWRTWKDGLLSKTTLANIPFFMCGGGVRMSYYQQLEPQLSSMAGYSWLKAECWVMGVPDDLVADGVGESEYDRLSVAYGLSRLEVGKIIKAMPQPKIEIEPVSIWRDNYVDKDQC